MATLDLNVNVQITNSGQKKLVIIDQKYWPLTLMTWLIFMWILIVPNSTHSSRHVPHKCKTIIQCKLGSVANCFRAYSANTHRHE